MLRGSTHRVDVSRAGVLDFPSLCALRRPHGAPVETYSNAPSPPGFACAHTNCSCLCSLHFAFLLFDCDIQRIFHSTRITSPVYRSSYAFIPGASQSSAKLRKRRCVSSGSTRVCIEPSPLFGSLNERARSFSSNCSANAIRSS